MALASVGAKTPFFTSTFSNAETLASLAVVTTLTLGLGVGLGLGLPAFELASAAVEFAEFPVAVLASLFPAITGAAAMATNKRLHNHFLSFSIKRVSPSGRGL